MADRHVGALPSHDQTSQPVGERVQIGGRYGSPTVTVALPFSNVQLSDPGLVDAVRDLAALVQQTAASLQLRTADRNVELARIQQAAGELAQRLADR
jgi:hypothetical protein